MSALSKLKISDYFFTFSRGESKESTKKIESMQKINDDENEIPTDFNDGDGP